MKAEVSNEGRIKPGSWYTVYVDLTNQGAELTGQLVVDAPYSGGFDRVAQYVVPVSLPAGAKKRVPIEVPNTFGNGQATVRFEADGEVVAKQTLNLNLLPYESVLIGVLSDDELGIPALTRLAAPGGQAVTPNVVRLDAAKFPDRAALLESLDVIAISRFDASSLNSEQLLALESWVGRGGTLLLAGGPEWKRTFAPLPKSLLPVEVTSVREADIAQLGEFAGKPVTGQAMVSAGPVAHGQAIVTSGDVPLVVKDTLGAGTVIYVAFDPGLDPLARWEGQSDLFGSLLRFDAQRAKWEFGNRESMMQNALHQVPGMGLPAVGLVIGLLSAYLILIGPVNYMVLKKLDRRELAWVSVPVLSLLFVGSIYTVGMGGRVPVVSHVITATELSPGAKTATQSTYVGVYAPALRSTEVSMANAKLVRPLTIYGGGAEQGNVATRITKGDKTTVELLEMNNYSMKGFSMEQDVSVGGGLTLTDLSIDQNGLLTARLTNNLDRTLTDVQVRQGLTSVTVGDIAAGAKSEPFQLDLAAPSPDPRAGFYEGWRSDRSVEENRKAAILDAVRNDYTRIYTSGLLVTGWTEQPLADVSLPSLGRTFAGANLVFLRLPVPVSAETGDIPPGVVTGVLTTNGAWGQGPYGINLGPGNHTFQFSLPQIDRTKIADLKVHVQPTGGDVAGWALKVKNQSSGEWVDLQMRNAQSVPNWEQMLTKENTMEIRLDVSNHLELLPPTISTKGGAR